MARPWHVRIESSGQTPHSRVATNRPGTFEKAKGINMRSVRRLVLGLGFPMLVVATIGCGGTGADDAASAQAANGGSISATPAVYNGYTTITLYPGRFADEPMTVEFKCYQGAVLVLANGSYELHYAIENGVPGYSLLGDHYEIVQGPLRSQSYTGGAAECDLVARHYSKRATDFATGAFSIAP